MPIRLSIMGSLTFGGASSCLPQFFAYTIPIDSLVPRWMVTWKATGVTAWAYQLPVPFIITRASYRNAINSAIFDLNTTLPSVHADWREGSVPGTGIVTFTQSQSEYLDLSELPDVSNDETFPEFFGGAGNGVTIEMWIQRPGLVTECTNAIFLQCSLGAGSSWDAFTISQNGNSADFRYTLQQDGTTVANTLITSTHSVAWRHILFRQSQFGEFTLYVDGVLVSGPTVSAAPNYASRSSCRVGRSTWGTGPGFWSGSLAALRMWNRDVIPAEVQLLRNNPPSNIYPSVMLMIGLSPLLILGAEVNIWVKPSAYWGTALNAHFSVNLGTINATTF